MLLANEIQKRESKSFILRNVENHTHTHHTDEDKIAVPLNWVFKPLLTSLATVCQCR